MKFGFVDSQGHLAVTLLFDDADWSGFKSGLAAVALKKPDIPRWGYIDLQGRIVIELQYHSALPFCESGNAIVYLDLLENAMIDRDRGLIFQRPNGEVFGFNNDRALLVQRKEGGTQAWGILDSRGRVIVEPRYQGINLCDGEIIAFMEGGKWGYLDWTGEVKNPPRFDRTYGFHHGIGPVAVDVQLLDHIAKSKNIILILSPEALDRCQNEEDWVRREIAESLQRKKHIIPVLKEGFKFPKPETLPADIRGLER